MRLPRVTRRRLLVALLVPLVLLGALSVWPLPEPTGRFNRGENAAWLRHRWFTGELQWQDLAMPSGVRDLYVHVGPLDAAGRIPPWDEARWTRSLAEARTRLPAGTSIHAWLGGVTTFFYGKAPDTVDLADAGVRANIAATAADVVRRGRFDGVHYDLEHIQSGDRHWLDLLERTRAGLPDRMLSAAVFRVGPLPHLWSVSYLHEVARRVDQAAVMSYDTAMPTPRLYARLLASEVPALCGAMAGTKCQLLLGVPTYDEWTPGHWPYAETPAAALQGIRLGLQESPHRDAFQGIAIYAEWTTSSADWADIVRGWP